MEESFDELMDQYLTGAITAEGKVRLAELLGQAEYQERLEKRMESSYSEDRFTGEGAEEIRVAIQAYLSERIQDQKPARLFHLRRYVAAASVIILIALGTYVYFLNKKEQETKTAAREKIQTDILPGHDGAILTLADGRTIVLDSARDGKLTDAAVKNGNKISYANSDPAKVEYNTMTTPKGRQFSLVLPDGSQVWLNAESSITYPTAFAGEERKVSITGEAYFEVAHDASKPFHVDVNGMDVQVLGTHFNINAYADEGNIKTTLLQGSIKLSSSGKVKIVKPGEQAQVSRNEINLVADADLDAVMAWKNGFFSFDNATVVQIMNQLSRWYDVQVVYEGNPQARFAGKIDRSLTLTQVLKLLADTKVHYRMEDGKRLIILP